MYNLRQFTQTEHDLGISLEKVAAMGYKTVQISGIGNIAASRVRALCDGLGLSIVLTHMNADRIMYDTDAIINENEAMGCMYIGMGMMPERYRGEAWLDQFIVDYTPAAKKIAAAGKLLMYHNHEFEFAKINGKLVMDFLMEGFEPSLMGFTFDTYWAQAGGADVYEWIAKLKGRMPCVHLKDMGVLPDRGVIMTPIMEGNLNFPKILEALEADGGVKYLLIEQDHCQGSPFACLETSYKNLSKLGYK